MKDAFLPIDAPVAFTTRALAECAEREVRYRKHVYPNLVAKGSMSAAKMEFEIAAMQAIAERLRAKEKEECGTRDTPHTE